MNRVNPKTLKANIDTNTHLDTGGSILNVKNNESLDMIFAYTLIFSILKMANANAFKDSGNVDSN